MQAMRDHGSPRHVLVAGATGYIGRRLVPELVAAGHQVRCLARSPEKLDAEWWRTDVDVVAGDALDAGSLRAAFDGVDAAYYLVHAIGSGSAWQSRDRKAAENFRDAAAQACIEQLIYLGGLGDDAEVSGALSPHLASRHEVGSVLAAGSVPLTELRAAVVIGSGSSSFEMLRHLVEVLPVMTTPRWVETRVQPIAVRDVLAYLTGVLGHRDAYGHVFEIGGTDVVTYREMMNTYASVAGLRKRMIIPVPVLSPRLSSLWVGLVTPIPADLARPLIDSLVNEVVVRDRTIDRVVPHRPIGCREAIVLALRRVGELDGSTNETDAEPDGSSPADPLPTDPDWAGATVPHRYSDGAHQRAARSAVRRDLRAGRRRRLARRQMVVGVARLDRSRGRWCRSAAGTPACFRVTRGRRRRLLARRGARGAATATAARGDATPGRRVARMVDYPRRPRCATRATCSVPTPWIARTFVLVCRCTVPPVHLRAAGAAHHEARRSASRCPA